ncbi:Mis12-Mtw1 protein family-domain-containing protein [Amylocarpus encephaloides]|uniref:Mis12-Mtw1 protein family-domain-containing protein n=1 Tax=Amylocarpus encephaloides TaxID=45428 RepID=A0A9P7YAT7_9HELO|nr:Mis12-Mtw1 protein family-domain-containing protein [Amylocarpus encephaloides]
MTTLVRTRMPLETLSMSQPNGRRRSKRLAAYDEEDGDFVFSRGPKRTNTAPAPPIVEAPEPAPQTSSNRGKRPKERDHEVEPREKKSRARQIDLSTPRAPSDTIIVPRRRKSTRSSTGKTQNEDGTSNTSVNGATDVDKIELVGSQRVDDTTYDTTKPTIISLPFSDTPVINRNKEMRKKANGPRRSSLGLRGRRASSLISNGHSAIPHREVETSEFYKHIEADGLSEPRRMKQLLTWTGERELGEKPSHGEANDLFEQAARTIKEGLLKDFSNKSEYSDWFTREDLAPRKVIKKPNPRNIELAEQIGESDARIKLLKQERDQWKALAKSPAALPRMLPENLQAIKPSNIDASLLSPEQADILAAVSSIPALDLRNHIAQQVQDLLSGLEFQVDQFADGVHKLEQYKNTADRAANKVLAISAVRLDERDRKEKESVGTRDIPMQEVLRSLSRILPKEQH